MDKKLIPLTCNQGQCLHFMANRGVEWPCGYTDHMESEGTNMWDSSLPYWAWLLVSLSLFFIHHLSDRQMQRYLHQTRVQQANISLTLTTCLCVYHWSAWHEPLSQGMLLAHYDEQHSPGLHSCYWVYSLLSLYLFHGAPILKLFALMSKGCR